MTHILMMTLTPQLRKVTEKRTSDPPSIRESDIIFNNFVEKPDKQNLQ